MTYDSRAKSEKSIRVESVGKDDMFTSMRNILNKEDGASLLTSKNNVNESAAPKAKEDSERNEQLRKQTTSKVRTLKKEQVKLKNTI